MNKQEEVYVSIRKSELKSLYSQIIEAQQMIEALKNHNLTLEVSITSKSSNS